MSNYISTVSGKQFHFANPTPGMIDIQDIAHALGNLCRFTGQCRQFYSVAEHSVLLSQIVPKELALMGLLHDATEAYCADLARPLKQLLPDYQVVEERIWQAVAAKFALPVDMPPEIKRADMQMLKTEVFYLLPRHCLHELNLPGGFAPGIKPRCWSPSAARFYFIQRYQELTGETI